MLLLSVPAHQHAFCGTRHKLPHAIAGTRHCGSATEASYTAAHTCPAQEPPCCCRQQRGWNCLHRPQLCSCCSYIYGQWMSKSAGQGHQQDTTTLARCACCSATTWNVSTRETQKASAASLPAAGSFCAQGHRARTPMRHKTIATWCRCHSCAHNTPIMTGAVEPATVQQRQHQAPATVRVTTRTPHKWQHASHVTSFQSQQSSLVYVSLLPYVPPPASSATTHQTVWSSRRRKAGVSWVRRNQSCSAL